MLRRLRHLFDHLSHRRRVEDELHEEVEASFAMTVDRFVAQGMSLSAARRAARIEFEGVEQVKEKIRDGLVGSASWYSSRMRATPGAGSAGVPRSPSLRCSRWHWALV